MGYIAPGEIFEKMLQLTRFNVHLEAMLNKNNGYFQIEIMILAAHIYLAPREILKTFYNSCV